jgi:SAM-dependent methyltransferase
MGFEDHFSRLAQQYARYRPRYPAALFEYLASAAPGRALAWDCGAGNGQAAVSLAGRFRHVTATDASWDQIRRAQPHPRVDYRVEQAESPSLPSRSCDLITVAVAVHWFAFGPFYRSVARVLKPGGLLAVWTYHNMVGKSIPLQ